MLYLLTDGIKDLEYWCFTYVDIINWILLWLLVVGYSTFNLSMFILFSVNEHHVGEMANYLLLKLWDELWTEGNIVCIVFPGMSITTLTVTLGVDVLFHFQHFHKKWCKLYILLLWLVKCLNTIPSKSIVLQFLHQGILHNVLCHFGVWPNHLILKRN